jgi:hypothetical protein
MVFKRLGTSKVAILFLHSSHFDLDNFDFDYSFSL